MLSTIQKESLIKKIFFCFFVFFFCIFPGHIFSAPHNGDVFELAQPDGTLVAVKVFGDEFYQHVESSDGFTLMREPDTGWITYANLQADGMDLVSTGVVYKPGNDSGLLRGDRFKGFKEHIRIKKEAVERVVRRHKKILDPYAAPEITTSPGIRLPEGIQPAPEAAPFSGNIVGMTLLIDFPDVKSSISRNDIVNMLNQSGYAGYSNNGSVRDYYYEASHGQLTYTNQVTQFVTVSKPKSYYDDNTEYGHVKELTVEALGLLRAQGGFDFSACSKTGDRFYAVNILYAGSPAAGWAKGLWPHSGNLGGAWSENGTYVRNYQMSNIGTSLSIGTFVHENGHMLCGFKDLYAYDGHDKGIGNFCVMCYNDNKNPQMFNPYFRYLMGWLSFADIGNVTNGTFSCTANQTDSAYFYGLNGGGTEFFLIEARRKAARSAVLPAEGLIIWHINIRGDNMYADKDNYISVEQADGWFDLENNVNTGDVNDSFRSGYRTSFDDTTTPDARYYSGANSGLKVRNVSTVGNTMTFDIGNGGPTATPVPSPTPTPTPTTTPSPSPSPLLMGDANGDGKIDINDALLVARYSSGLAVTININAADMDNDGRITIVDALKIAQYTVM